MNRREATLSLLGATLGMILPGCATTGKPDTEKQLLTMDTHAHIFHRGLTLAGARRYAPDYDAPLDVYLATLTQHGMARGVLVQPSFLGTDNSYLLSALRQHPERLRGIAVIETDMSLAQMQELKQQGIAGVRLNLIGKPLPDFTQAAWPGFLSRVATLDWQVEIHREAKDLPQIVPPLLQSGVKVVLDHFGRPDPVLGVNDPGFRYVLEAAKTRRIWVKISGSYRNGANGAGERTALAAIPLLREHLGLDRMVWGSDWPHTQFESTISYDKVRAELDTWLPDPADRKIVLEQTPAKLFGFDA